MTCFTQDITSFTHVIHVIHVIVGWLLIVTTNMVMSVMTSSVQHGHHVVPVPEFLPGPINVTVREGGVAKLPCGVKDLGTKKIAWRRVRDDRFMTIGLMTWTSDPHFSMDHSRDRRDDVTHWDLIISHVSKQDGGHYECSITSQAGANVRRVTLIVANAETMISVSGKRYVDIGQPIKLTCNASGGTGLVGGIDWFMEGDQITTDKPQFSHITITKYQSLESNSFISQIIIDHSTLEDSGDYVCRSDRDNIANLRVTVLHAERESVKRGAYTGETSGVTSQHMTSLHHVTLLVAILALRHLLFLSLWP